MKINTQGHVENMNHSKLILQGRNAETRTEQEAKATKISKCHKDCQITYRHEYSGILQNSISFRTPFSANSSST